MKIRNVCPDKTNKYYIRKAAGGYSTCIPGYPLYFPGSALANCVAYALGRFNEETDEGEFKYAISGNAENFIDNCPKELKKGKTPKQGAIICWQKGPTKDGSDGAGHVEIVEKVINPYTIFTSASGYGDRIFYTNVRTDSSEWNKGGNYKFLGFIYNPGVTKSTTLLEDWQKAASLDGYYAGKVDNIFGPVSDRAAAKIMLVKGSNDLHLVKWLQEALAMYGYYTGYIDGDFGPMTYSSVIKFQREHRLVVDGKAGRQTIRALLYI